MELLVSETWRPAPGYEGLYEVSSIGNVRSITRTIFRDKSKPEGMPRTYYGQIKKPIINRTGYYKVNLGKNGKMKQPLVHQLVAKAFIPNPNGYPFVNHIDGCKTNNREENLEWCTPKMNAIHAFSTGLMDNAVQQWRNRQPKILVRSYAGEEVFIGSAREVAEKYGYCNSNAITAALRYNNGRLPRAKITVQYL